MDNLEDLAIGWTTFEKLGDAQSCARALVEENLAFCAQVESPVQSFYRWEGKVDDAVEFPVRVKHAVAMAGRIEEWLREKHPYKTPQWITIKACTVMPEYHLWALQNFQPPSGGE